MQGAFAQGHLGAVPSTSYTHAGRPSCPGQSRVWHVCDGVGPIGTASRCYEPGHSRRGGRRASHVVRILPSNQSGWQEDDDYPLEVPTKFELSQRPDKKKPLVKVRLNVHYRVHSRQMLCIGGSQIPLGWSFLSIAKVPMTWNNGDIWTCEVELQAGQWIEYKYVILEEQDWTKLENEDAQGLVEITYRTGDEPGRPPDVQAIQKQMAIVAWQPGPNRTLKVPTENELADLKPGQAIERIPARPGQRIPYENTTKRPAPLKPDPFEGTWEVLTLDKEGEPFLDRHDVWGWTPPGFRPGLGGSSSNSSNSSSSGPGPGSGGRSRGFNLG